MGTYSVSQVGPLSAWTDKTFVESDLASAFIGLSVNSTAPGGTSPFWHTHSKIDELYVFLEGTGDLALDEDVLRVEAGTIVRVGPDVWRALRCSPESEVPLKWLCLRAGGQDLKTIGNDADLDRERPWPWD